MDWADTSNAPSSEAQAFLANPANRRPETLDLADLPAERAEGEALACENEADLCGTHGVDTAWADIAGIRCLEVTPAEPRSDGALLYLFGGGFISGGPLQDLQIIAPIAAQTGMRVIAPAYRLAPEHPFPASLEDVKAVARHLAEAGPYQISGESAGGNLAVSLTHWIIAQGLRAPLALALLSPATDLSGTFDQGDAPDDPTLRPVAVQQISQIYAGSHDLFDPALSPVFGSFGKDWPATLITTGTRDYFLHQCKQLRDVITQAGSEVHLRIWPGLWHVFEYYPEIPEAAVSLTDIALFLNAKSAIHA